LRSPAWISSYGAAMPKPRPDHPDFWLMCAAIKSLDTASDEGVDFQEIIGDVDFESLTYVTEQRALRAIMLLAEPIPREAQVSAAWIDGFMVGSRFRKLKDKAQDA
jgi:hypothetical protein